MVEGPWSTAARSSSVGGLTPALRLRAQPAQAAVNCKVGPHKASEEQTSEIACARVFVRNGLSPLFCGSVRFMLVLWLVCMRLMSYPQSPSCPSGPRTEVASGPRSGICP